MSPSRSDSGASPAPPGRGETAARDPGAAIPKRPADSTASGDAQNDTGEDNQRQKGESADDYIRR